ncbi:MAG: hypothetical protein PHY93_02495 [Bacteriovorax sp.]|nr:hypothetical protein [Bacteriovorax sp.]
MVLILEKRDLNLKEIKGFILSPGNIFWQQKSGTHVLLSAKSDFLNIHLIEKMFKANHVLLIEDQINLQLQHDFVEFFKGHHSEILVKEKLKWRRKLMNLFSEELGSDEASQFEVDQLAWSVFSKIDREQSRNYLEKDIDLFKRSMSMATGYTLCAFLLGYYHDDFLSQIFTETFLNLMDLKISVPLQTLKMQLEKIRTQENLQVEDQQILEDIYQLSNNRNLLLGERYNGSGAMQINKHEMTDLELVLVALNNHYSFSCGPHKSIFYEIKNSLFKCDEKILNVLRKSLETKKEIAPLEMGA